MRILGFWHIANVGVWNRIWLPQLERLSDSGLLEATERLHVGMVGEMTPEFKDAWKYLCQFQKIDLEAHPDREVFEFPTVGRAGQKARAEREPFYAYYIHVKGAMTANHDRKDESPAYWWKEYMEHYVVGRWRDCVAKLEEGYETVGVEWRESPAKHYSGNFWWARSEYLKRLPEMADYWAEHRRDRIQAEMWIGRGDPKYCELKRYGQDLYRFKVGPEMWD